MNIIICSDFQFISGSFSYQMATVACCIDQDIFRFTFQSAFDNSLQIFIFYFELFKRKIVHINDKFIITVFDLCDDLVQIYKLMFIHFYDSQAFIIIFIQNSLNTGRFTGSRISKEQTVVRLSASDKSFCILNQFLFWNLISNQILQLYMCNSCYRYDHCSAVLVMINTESLVKSELTYTKILVKLYHVRHKFIGVFGYCQRLAHITDSVTDTFVEHFSRILRCLIITENAAAGSME